MAGNLALAGSAIGALGIFCGFYFLSTDWRSVVGAGLFAAMLGVFALRAFCG